MKTNIFFGIIPVVALSFVFYVATSQGSSSGRGNHPETEKGIRFESRGWSYALTQAKKEHKLVFLDAFTSWCGPCKLLKKHTFTDSVVGQFFNEHFINVTEDMEKGIGIELAKKYAVTAYPTLLITDSDGNVITYTKGYLSPRDLLEFGKYGLGHE